MSLARIEERLKALFARAVVPPLPKTALNAHRQPAGNRRGFLGQRRGIGNIEADGTSGFGARLSIGRADDPLEREADRVADQVMGISAPELSVTTGPTQINRKCAACEEEEAALQRKPADGPSGAVLGGGPGIVQQAIRTPGQPLDAAARAYFEPRFGRDLTGVRVHTDAVAAESARAVNAVAYTVGPDVAFGTGRYMPGSEDGRWLLAHELSHVLQQAELQTPRVQRQAPEDVFTGTKDPVDDRFDRFAITRSDLSDPKVTARLRSLSNDELSRYHDRVSDPEVKLYVLGLLFAAEAEQSLQSCVTSCLDSFASFERVFKAVGFEVDVMECYDKLQARAAQGRPPLTAEAGCAQCITNCSGDPMELEQAITTCRDELLNQCISVTDFWKAPLFPIGFRSNPQRGSRRSPP